MLNSEQLSCLTGPNLINDAQLSSQEDQHSPQEEIPESPSKKEESKSTNLADNITDLISEFESHQPSFNQDFINYISKESLEPVGSVTKIYGDKYLLQAETDSLKKVGVLDLNNFVFVLTSNGPALLGYVSDVLGQIQHPLYEIQRHTTSKVEAKQNLEVFISMLKIKTISMQEILQHKGRDYELDQNGNVVMGENESDQQFTNFKPEKKKPKKNKRKQGNKTPTQNYGQFSGELPVPSYNQPYVFNPQYCIPQVPFTAYAPSAYHVMSAPSPFSINQINQPAVFPPSNLPPHGPSGLHPSQPYQFYQMHQKKE